MVPTTEAGVPNVPTHPLDLLAHATTSSPHLVALPQSPIEITAIVTAAIQTATSGMATATSAAHAVATVSVGVGAIVEENILHLKMICGVPTNADILVIWTAVANIK